MDLGAHEAVGRVRSLVPPTEWDPVILFHYHVFLLLYHRSTMENTFVMNLEHFNGLLHEKVVHAVTSQALDSVHFCSVT